MTRTLSAVLLALVLPLAGCGMLPSGDGDTESAADSVVSDSQALLDSLTVLATQATQAAGTAQAAADSASTAAAQLAPDSLTVDQRIDRLVVAQQNLAGRIDSLLTAMSPNTAAPADSTNTIAAGGEVLGNQVRNFGVGIFWSVIVVVFFNVFIRVVVWVLDRLSERSAKRRLFFKRLVPIVRIVLWIFAAYLIVSVIFQVDAQGIFAAAAAIGVAVGFAAQDLLKNLFGGLILVFDQPFQVGDKISVGGTYGEVVSIGLRSTRIVTPDDNLVSVPNSQVVDQQVANANAGELNCQVVTDVYLPGWADEAKAKKIAFEAAASSKYVYLNKPIVTLVKDEFKETFLTRVRVKAYVLDPRFEFLFQSDVTERARAGFRAAGMLGREQRIRGYIDVGEEGAGPPRTATEPVPEEPIHGVTDEE